MCVWNEAAWRTMQRLVICTTSRPDFASSGRSHVGGVAMLGSCDGSKPAMVVNSFRNTGGLGGPPLSVHGRTEPTLLPTDRWKMPAGDRTTGHPVPVVQASGHNPGETPTRHRCRTPRTVVPCRGVMQSVGSPRCHRPCRGGAWCLQVWNRTSRRTWRGRVQRPGSTAGLLHQGRLEHSGSPRLACGTPIGFRP